MRLRRQLLGSESKAVSPLTQVALLSHSPALFLGLGRGLLHASLPGENPRWALPVINTTDRSRGGRRELLFINGPTPGLGGSL